MRNLQLDDKSVLYGALTEDRMPGHNQMKRTILEFSGIKPVTVSSFGPIKDSNQKKREKWLAQANAYGYHA